MNARQIVIIQRRLTHYRVALFEKLREELKRHDIRLRLVVGEGTEREGDKHDSGEISWADNVPTRYWINGKICWQPTYHYINDADLVIVTQENSQIVNQLLVLSPFRPKMAFWGHGVNFQAGNPNGLKERYKAWASRRVDWWFAYTSISTGAVIRTGFDPARITTLNNSVEIEGASAIGTDEFQSDGSRLLKTLGLEEKRIGVFVGSLYRDKRLDFLLEALDAIQRHVPDFGFLFIGDGPDRVNVERFCRERAWAVWVGPRFGAKKLLHMSQARVMLNPGLVGLGILDSFAMGVPMVTTDCGLHSPEIAYLVNGENGQMTENTLSSFVAHSKQLLTDDGEWSRLRAGALQSAEEYSLDNMVARFSEGIVRALAAGRVGGRKSVKIG